MFLEEHGRGSTRLAADKHSMFHGERDVEAYEVRKGCGRVGGATNSNPNTTHDPMYLVLPYRSGLILCGRSHTDLHRSSKILALLLLLLLLLCAGFPDRFVFRCVSRSLRPYLQQ